jgi:hypothetical protein
LFCTRARRYQNRTEACPRSKVGGIHYGSAFGLFDSATFSLVRSNRIEAAIGAASKAKRKLT